MPRTFTQQLFHKDDLPWKLSMKPLFTRLRSAFLVHVWCDDCLSQSSACNVPLHTRWIYTHIAATAATQLLVLTNSPWMERKKKLFFLLLHKSSIGIDDVEDEMRKSRAEAKTVKKNLVLAAAFCSTRRKAKGIYFVDIFALPWNSFHPTPSLLLPSFVLESEGALTWHNNFHLFIVFAAFLAILSHRLGGAHGRMGGNNYST